MHPPRRSDSAYSGRPAFTLIELLVVISIIVVLIGILIPVVSKVRDSANAANTKAQLAQLSARIEAYYGDFSAFPGPIPNTQLRFTLPANDNHIDTFPVTTMGAKITMAENLYLGLMGGLKLNTAAAGTFIYDPALAGLGPRSLGTIPKKYLPYGDNTDISAGAFVDEGSNKCNDSVIPEFVDRFPDPIPFLYFRARPGMVEVVLDTPGAAQYDLTQVSPYTDPVGTDYIGSGKRDDGEPRKNPTPVAGVDQWYHHGFRTTDITKIAATTDTSVATNSYPYNIHAALRHPTLDTATTPVAKQKDRYILISAGVDRIYGTKDDITNFGNY